LSGSSCRIFCAALTNKISDPRLLPAWPNWHTKVPTDNAEGFKQGAKFGESALSKQAEGTLLKTLLC
jgi:hypothetical protein